MRIKLILLLTTLFSSLFAEGTSAEEYRAELEAGNIDEYCFLTGESEYLPISDETGKKVFSKKEKNLICEKIVKKEGECLEWETITQEYTIDKQSYNVYETDNFESDMGSVLGTVTAMGKIKDILGGWKGYCESGMWTDFSWASDPLFWAGMALSYAAGAASEASKAPAVAKEAQNIKDAQSYLELAKNLGDADAVAAANKALEEAYKSYASAIETTLKATYENMGGTLAFMNANKCLISAGIDAARGLRNYLSDGDDGEACDPIDEICEDTDDSEPPQDPITLDESEYDYLVEELIANDLDPDDIITIIKEEDGIYTVILSNPVNIDYNAESSALQEAKEQMKMVQGVIDGAIVGAKLAGCYATGGAMGGSQGSNFDGKISGEQIAKMGLNIAAGMVPPPWGQILQIALKLVDSFKFGNTCTDLEFANEMTQQGARPVQASQNKSLKAGMAHFVYEKCVYKFFGSCERTRYVYCNYDQFLNKILVEQMKLQMGKDWMHCSDISLDELKNINFQACPAGTINTRANPRWYDDSYYEEDREIIFFDESAPSLVDNTPVNTVNGAITEIDGGPFMPPTGMGDENNPFDNPTSTAQYQQKCIDYTEFIEKLKDQMGSEFDKTQIDDMFKDLGVDAPEISVDTELTN